MKIKNNTKRTLVSEEIYVCKTYQESIVGLIGKQHPQGILFKTRFGIHTFGVKFPIDVIILDNKLKVKAMKKSLQPNRIFFWNPTYDTVLELPEKTIAEAKVEIDDQLSFS